MENGSRRPDDTTESSQIKDLGTINIEFRRRKILGRSPAKSREAAKNLGGASVVTEKQLKGKSVTHGVAYGSLLSCSSALALIASPTDWVMPEKLSTSRPMVMYMWMKRTPQSRSSHSNTAHEVSLWPSALQDSR